ncbi:MAG: YfiR family protein [Deltaproteobacteria bacterium]
MPRMGDRVGFVFALAAICLVTWSAQADEVTVPIDFQIDLLGRVVRFERGYASHGSEPALVVLVAKRDLAASERAAAQAKTTIGEVGNLGGRPTKVVTHTFSSPALLRAAAPGAAILYFMPGFNQAELRGIAASYLDSNVLTVGASYGDAENGAALGFEVESSKPGIVVNLPQARSQGLDFSAQFLRLVRVIK